MKIIHALFLSSIIFGACSSSSESGGQDMITISGTVGHPQEGMILLERFEGVQPMPFDTINLNDDYTYEKKVHIETPGYYRLNFYNKQAVPLILDDEDVVVNVDGNDPRGFSEVKGSSDHQFIKDVQLMAQQFQSSEKIQNINRQFTEARQAGDEEQMEKLREQYFALEKDFKQQLKAKIDSTGASLGVLEVLQNGKFFDPDKDYEIYKEYAKVVEKEMPDVPLVQNFVDEVERMGKIAIGQMAPEIALPNPDGVIVKLSSLRGNYVLVDFWAKWCKPCRMENPNVVRMYKKYNDKGFEVYGVSLDRKKEDWLQAIEEDQLHWTQVSDLKFWNSEAAKTYNISAIPFAVLLDPEGRIIAKNLRGQALENRLEEIFNK